METLLSHAFDHLTSPSTTKIRRGLRQLEGLLAQLCLSLPPSVSPQATQPPNAANTKPTSASAPTTIAPSSTRPTPKHLSSLPYDPAFRAFSLLQNTFQYNVCIHLVGCLERLLGKGNSGENDLLIIKCLEILVGCLLVHAESRELWARGVNVNLLLDLLDPASCPAVHIATLHALTAALIDHPVNTRVFEELDGLLVVTSLFKSRQTSREVKREVVEFCYFYLGAESADSEDSATQGKDGLFERKEEGLRGALKRTASDGQEEGVVGGPVGGMKAAVVTENKESGKSVTRTMTEKQALLGRYLSNVQDLVEDMKDVAEKGVGVGYGRPAGSVSSMVAVAV